MRTFVKKYFDALLEAPGKTAHEGIDYFRHRLLVSLLLCLGIFCTVAYIPSVYYGYLYRFRSVILLDTLTVAGVFFLLFRRRMNFLPRALGLLAIFYVLGVWLLFTLGPTGAGFLWLLLFSIMTGVLLGLAPALASLGLNLVTLAALSVPVYKQILTWALLPEDGIAIWTVNSVNFICINAIVAASTGFIVAKISRTAEAETRRRIQLDREIQARIQAEKENKALTERLYQSQKMEAIGTLAGGVAHDFNNIISTVTGYTELMRLEPGLPGEVQSYLEKISQAADRAKGITRQILTFGRKEPVLKTPYDLGAIARESIDLIKVGIPSDIRLEIDIHPDPVPVLGDKNQLFQVIMNLLTNGIQAMDNLPHGRKKRLSLSLSHPPDALTRELHDLSPEKSYVMLKVADTGSGICREHINRIFDPYFTTKKSGDGTGLGLSITHSIIKNHGGVIWVGSNPGEGTWLTVVLPAHHQKPVEGFGEDLSPEDRNRHSAPTKTNRNETEKG